MKENLKIAFLVFLFLLTNQSCNRTNNNNSTIRQSSIKERKHNILGGKIAKEVLDRFLKDSSFNLFKGKVLIKDKQTLNKIIEPILFNIYGEKQIVSERPY